MLNWYAICSKPQKEIFVYEQLTLRGLESYCPSVHVQGINPRGRKFRPYFPGYLFVHVDFEKVNVSILRWLPGAIGVVSFGGEPAWVPDNLLKAIRCRVDQINMAGGDPTLTMLRPGDEVMIHSGPFAGYEAIFCAKLRDNERVQVLLRVLQDRALRIDLPVTQLIATKQNRL